MKTYPKGAIKSVAEFVELLAGGRREFVEASRKHFVHQVKLTGQLGFSGKDMFANCEHRGRLFLRDKNIPVNTYNDWFLFTTRADAEAYVNDPVGMTTDGLVAKLREKHAGDPLVAEAAKRLADRVAPAAERSGTIDWLRMYETRHGWPSDFSIYDFRAKAA